MALELTVVDAFTDRPFSGNPAAVAVVDAFPAEDRMQAIAAGMDLAETAFVVHAGATIVTTSGGSPPPSRSTCAGTPPWPPPMCSAGRPGSPPGAGCSPAHVRRGRPDRDGLPLRPARRPQPAPPGPRTRGVQWFGRGRPTRSPRLCRRGGGAGVGNPTCARSTHRRSRPSSSPRPVTARASTASAGSSLRQWVSPRIPSPVRHIAPSPLSGQNDSVEDRADR